DLSKVEAGRMELELGPIMLGDLLRHCQAMVTERAMRHAIALRLDVDPRVEIFEADERKVKQVLLNLLSNALKFTPDGGTIDLAARQEGEEVLVSVRDSGIGIPPDDLERIFERFLQGRQSAQQRQEGTGLGLALSRRFVELHGGRIWVESEVG